MYSGGRPMEMGFCSMHHRKRIPGDLVPWNEQPELSRCNPLRECRQREPVQSVTCSLHNRRRNAVQMKEVSPGVWECLPNFLCRQFGNGPSARPVPGQPGSFSPYGGHRGGGPDYGGNRFDSATAAMWAPSSAPIGGDGAQYPPPSRPPHPRETGYVVERRVFCARHGKLLYVTQCELVQDSCYVCIDPSTCLSTPLDTPSEVAEKGCAEVICAKHSTLRAAGFTEWSSDKSGYQCIAGHPCRGVTLQTVEAQAQSSRVDGSGMGGAGDHDNGDEFGFGQGYLGPARGMAVDYGQPSGREAVSSFFV